ncbi:hypothetical protein BJX66DRAFT_336781 [Aspergillus keveii]|uniref:Uncharacterized protein n=1 Tax=Aspergillus keveii TaxID=714993 RepID=A0ABR4GAQ1_9EURO
MPSSTQTAEVSSNRTSVPPRPKGAIHRGNSLMVSLQSELASLPESLASDSSLYEFLDSRGIYAIATSNSISTSASTSPPDTPFTNISANTSATSISTTSTLTLSIPRSPHHLPLVITGCIHAGMSACEIGQYLHRVIRANGNDYSTTSSAVTTQNPTPVSSAGTRSGSQARTGVGLVSRMITLNKPYSSISTRVMRVLDLRSSDGYPLYAYVDPGDLGLVPRPGEPTRNDDSESDEDGSEDRRGLGSESTRPKRVWHWGPGQGLLRWPLLDMSDEEIERLVEVQDEDFVCAGNEKQDGEGTRKSKVNLPRLGCVSHHTVTIVYPASSPLRSIRVEFGRLGDESNSKWL